MTNNTYQTMSPEMQHERARISLVSYSVIEIQAILLLMFPGIKSRQAGAQIVREQMKAPAINDYTIEQPVVVTPQAVSSDVKLEGFEQFKRLEAAYDKLAKSYEDQNGLAA